MAIALGRPGKRPRNPIVAEDRRAGLVFVLPAMLVFGVFVFGAILFAFYVSLHDWKLTDRGGIEKLLSDPSATWVGLQKYHLVRAWGRAGPDGNRLDARCLREPEDSRPLVLPDRVLFPIHQFVRG